MNANKLKKLFVDLESLRSRKGNITEKEMVRFAKRCGRIKANEKTNHPTYINQDLPYSRPLSIPSHPGNLPTGTAGNILGVLEQDLYEIEEMLNKKSGGTK